MDKQVNNFMKVHLASLYEMKVCMGKQCLEIRKRNNLSREIVADRCGLSERSIAQIEQKFTTSLDLVNILYHFYVKEGYITREEQEQCSSKVFFCG